VRYLYTVAHPAWHRREKCDKRTSCDSSGRLTLVAERERTASTAPRAPSLTTADKDCISNHTLDQFCQETQVKRACRECRLNAWWHAARNISRVMCGSCPTQRFGSSSRISILLLYNSWETPLVCMHASTRSIIDTGMRIQRMQSRLACMLDCCPACCHRHHTCSGPAIAFTDGRAARLHRSTGNLSWSIHPRDNGFINVGSAMVQKCPALRSCRRVVSSSAIIMRCPLHAR